MNPPSVAPAAKPSRAVERFRWLNSTVLGIGLASLCSDVGHEMATAAMPALLASVGASSAALGVIEGLADGLSSFSKLLSGLHSDRLRRRKPLAVVGYFITASGMACFALATQWWHVLLARLFGWIGRGVRTPVRNVLLAEATTPETYGRAFGLERAMDSAGAIIGPALSLVSVAAIGLKQTFVFTLIPGCLAALLIAWLVREKPHLPQPQARLWTSFASLPTKFRRYLIGAGTSGLGDFSKTLLILWATQAWSARFGVARATVLAMAYYVGYNVIYALSCYISGLFADHFPKHRVLATGYAVAVIPAAMLLWPGDSFVKFAIVFGFSGLYMGVWETLENSTAAALLGASNRGVGFGVLATINGIGDFVSSLTVGILWTISPSAAMTFVIATAIAGACVIARAGVNPQAHYPLSG